MQGNMLGVECGHDLAHENAIGEVASDVPLDFAQLEGVDPFVDFAVLFG
jgi:hypothetical protein